MEKLAETRKQSFDSICYVIKALALFFCFYPLFDVCFNNTPMNSMSALSLRSVLTSVLLLVLILVLWMVLQDNNAKKPYTKWLEMLIFCGVCFASIWVSGGSVSTYKFLFVFMVVTYTIQYGMHCGMTIAIGAGLTLLGLDLLTPAAQTSFNPIFQSDIALSFMFIMIAYILGTYVRFEQHHIRDLMHLANCDSLTGLYNHRYFHDELNARWKDARENGTALSLIMLDIDYFKMYNDICGHQAGDRALETVSSLIRTNVRREDIVCRYGGEEFAVILPNINAKNAAEIAERIRTAICTQKIDGEEYMPGKNLTVSLGVSESTANDTDYNEVLSRADSALYRAKYLRKNRVESYQNILDRFSGLDEKTKEALLPIQGLISIINVRDDYTYSHTERVALCCGIAAKAMQLSESDTQTLLISAYMHDIGKINIPKEVLIANHRLTPEEWALIRHHPDAGKTILSRIAGMDIVAEIVSQHHERFDGSGYPRHLTGDEIHPLAAILALADSFDAMTNERPYQKKRDVTEALKELRRCAGTLYNPRFVLPFTNAIEAEIGKEALIPESSENTSVE